MYTADSMHIQTNRTAESQTTNNVHSMHVSALVRTVLSDFTVAVGGGTCVFESNAYNGVQLIILLAVKDIWLL